MTERLINKDKTILDSNLRGNDGKVSRNPDPLLKNTYLSIK